MPGSQKIRNAGCLLALFIAGSAQAATYYVDAGGGRDANPGTSPERAWKSLDKINADAFHPGDRVLFHRGSIWQGQLAPKGSGDAAAPLVFDNYGKGPLPRIEAEGKFEDAVRFQNSECFELHGLEVTNRGSAPGVRRGVHIVAADYGAVRNIVVSGLYVHDVNGSNAVKDNGGIVLRIAGHARPTWFDGLTVERNIIWKVDRTAIAFPNSYWRRTRFHPGRNVVIRDNYADDIGGDGIVPTVTEGVLVEHNIVRDCNRRAASYNAGIWPWSADNSVFQLNEASFTRSTLDGQGFDSDYNSHNTVFQYNYSHDNEGGFMLICSPGKRNAAENAGNTGTIVRYNISRNDGRGAFQLSSVENTTIEHNVVYVGRGRDIQMVMFTSWEGWADGTAFRDNTFYAEGTARYGHAAGKNEDGTYALAPGWGPARNVVFENNRYFGHHVEPPSDARVAEWSPGDAPKVDWNLPTFDPSAPENFDAFLKDHRAAMLRLMKAHFPGAEIKLRTSSSE
jgi:hypothetical protein